jgi:hypothetical protein
MAIPESQLETWSHQGSIQQSKATGDTIRTVLENGLAPYANQSYTAFLQGSYANDTNIFADSDVDIVMRLNSTYYYDLSFLTETDRSTAQSNITPATYDLDDFKRDVTAWLVKKYGTAVRPGTKAIFIKEEGARRDADVLPCAVLRKYSGPYEYVEGICFFMPDGTRIDNFPKQHSGNCTTKHQNTSQWFKRTVRVYKNMRNKMIDRGLLGEGVAPSYFLEGMLYNVPAAKFGGPQTQNFCNTFNWTCEADRSKFVCANEQFYLLNDYSPVTWRAANCNKFLNAAKSLWNNW